MEWLSDGLRAVKRLFTPRAVPTATLTLRQGTADFELFVATRELQRGTNLAHGLKHLANLLSYDPSRREWLDLVGGYLVAAGSVCSPAAGTESSPGLWVGLATSCSMSCARLGTTQK